jgi:hypothetical protein
MNERAPAGVVVAAVFDDALGLALMVAAVVPRQGRRAR